MDRISDNARQGTAAQRMFGAQAPVYATSAVHIGDASLEIMDRFAALSVAGRCRWAVDLGTGAGFTAFSMAPFAQRVLATDATLPMLRQTHRGSLERSLTNLYLTQNLAESLPLISDCVELITCRVAAHHFGDLAQALDEVRRVLRACGALILADSVAPEDTALAEWMNDVEARRDFSHVEDRKISEWETLLADRGLRIVQQEYTRIQLEFDSWVERTATPGPEVEKLRRDFLRAHPAAREAFQIRVVGDEIRFSWPCLVFRAVKE